MATKLRLSGDIKLTAEPARVDADGTKVFFINLDPFEVADRVRAKLFPGAGNKPDAAFDAIMREREWAAFKRRNA